MSYTSSVRSARAVLCGHVMLSPELADQKDPAK